MILSHLTLNLLHNSHPTLMSIAYAFVSISGNNKPKETSWIQLLPFK